ncbi:lamin tail domain-containing protein [Streptomyces cucumeris]|uniref:lamin tail domain-containing protein n=1 Tax=Streptomyces cucumeris TaxID=2962890 RepID=UPI003D702AB4
MCPHHAGGPVSKSIIARRLTAAALSAGALTAALTVPASAAAAHHPHRSDVQITRVQYNSPGWDDRSNRSLNDEWVEITNNSRRAVNLHGWTLSNRDGDTFAFRHYRLDGHSTVRVHTGIGFDRSRDVYQDRRDYVWDNRSDTATLRNDHRRFVDAQSWGRHHRGGRH